MPISGKYLIDNSSKRAQEKANVVRERPSNINFGKAFNQLLDDENP